MGDPACFLDATCLTCGRFLDSEELQDPTTCPHCGAELCPPRSEATLGGQARRQPGQGGRERSELVDQ